MAEIGRRGQRVDVQGGGDVDPVTGHLMSIAQLQAELRAQTTKPSSRNAMDRSSMFGQLEPQDPELQTVEGRGRRIIAEDSPPQAPVHGRALPVMSADSGAWLLVVAAQSGVGCSTTALAVADVAGQSGSRVHLVEAASGGHLSLAAATRHELGDVQGGWRRGRRGSVILDRPVADGARQWPPPPPVSAGQIPFMILDAGPAWAFPGADPDSGSAWWRCKAVAPIGVIVVCRATVPGVTAAERALYELVELYRNQGAKRAMPSLVVAAVGGARWRGAVRAACGPHLVGLLEQQSVVGIPRVRHLEVNGATAGALPRPVTVAGRLLWAQTGGAWIREGIEK